MQMRLQILRTALKLLKVSPMLFIIGTSNASQILELCPNPYGDDEAEYVKVFCNAECILSDGEGEVLINKTGVICIAKSKLAFYKAFGYNPDFEATGRFALSNSGETIFLISNGSVVDTFTYGKDISYLDEGVVYFRNNGLWDFRYQDWSDFPSITENVSGRIIVLPSDYMPKAKKEVILVSYILTDFSLLELAKKARIEVFLDAQPAGGIPLEEVEIVRLLPNTSVHFLAGSFKNFHYKFAIIDGKKVVITTENWKWNKRGYIIEFESEKVAKLLKDVLRHDLIYESNMGKIGHIKEVKGVRDLNAGDEFEFKGRIDVFVLPDQNPVFDVISSAKERLYIQAPYMDFQWFNGTPLLDAILKAAKNGADVKILLDSKYSVEKNQKTANFLNEIAKLENLKIEAKLIELRGFNALHAKMVVSDDKCMLTSANFNKYGLKLNREVGVVIYSKEASDFLADQFMEDWRAEGFGAIYAIPAIILLAFAIFIAYKGLKD